jgi:hypothetical protein
MEGINFIVLKECRSKRGVRVRTVKVKEKCFKTNNKPARRLLNVNAMIYLKFKLQLKFRNNEINLV